MIGPGCITSWLGRTRSGVNRGVEISAEVADSASSRIVDQVRAGLVTRMAVLYDLLTEPTTTGGQAALRAVEPAGQEVA